ncbi:unnamed protein product [Urochloa humidicola]
MYATAIALAVLLVSSSGVVDCSEVRDDAAAQPDRGHRAPQVPRPGARVRTPRRSASAASRGAPEDRPELVVGTRQFDQ